MTAARDLALETLQLEQDGRVLTARFSNPPLNFMTTVFIRELEQLTRSVDRDPTVGAVVLTGGVEGRFLTHLDAQELAGIGDLPHPKLPMQAAEVVVLVLNVVLRLPGVASLLERFGGAPGKGIVMGHLWKRLILRMNRSAAVYLAAINGPVLDGGLEIVLACDLRYAADAAHLRMAQMEMLVALIPGGGGSQRLLRMLGPARVLEHVLEGVPLTAQEALEHGLVHRVVPEKRLLAEAQATAARLARRSPTAVAALKRCLYFGTDRRFSRALDLESAGFLAAGSTKAAGGVLEPFLEDFERLGDTPFLADPGPWIEGTRFDQVGLKGDHMDRPIGQSRFSAAATYLVYQDGGIGDSQPQNMPGTEWKTKTLKSFAWGLWRQDLPVTNCRLAHGQRLGIEEIRIGRSLPQMLITLLTLGFVAPTQVSWRCCRPPSQSGTLD
jgi:enoyl-CoA hydratase